MLDVRRSRLAGSTAIAILLILCAPVAIAGSGRQRAVRTPALVVGTEYRIPAKPDNPWLESVAVASGASGGLVVWTESGPRNGESTVRFARIAADGHPIDATGQPLFENGHYQRHVAIDALNDQFLVTWCDITPAKNQIVALRLDAAGRALDSAPFVIADNVGTREPAVGVTCRNADCLVTWGGDVRDGSALSIGAVTGVQIYPNATQTTGVPLSLSQKGLANGIGTDRLNYCMVYAEQQVYGQSGALVAKLVGGNGTTTELSLPSSQQVQFGTTWVAWNGSQWFILLLDLTTSGGLSQEVRFMRVDGAGKAIGNGDAILLESSTVPLLCPQVPDLFLYDPQNRRVVWDGNNFLVFTQHGISRVTKDGVVGSQLNPDNYFPRSYTISIASSGKGRTLVAYSRDNAVAVRVIDDAP
jgi:hypothetical protein